MADGQGVIQHRHRLPHRSDPRPPSQKQMPARRRSDPLADIFDKEVVTVAGRASGRAGPSSTNCAAAIQSSLSACAAPASAACAARPAWPRTGGDLAQMESTRSPQPVRLQRHRTGSPQRRERRIDAATKPCWDRCRRGAGLRLERVQITPRASLRKVFYAVPANVLIATLRADLYDDRLELLLGKSSKPGEAAPSIAPIATGTCARGQLKQDSSSPACKDGPARHLGQSINVGPRDA